MREAIAICQSLPGPLAIQVGIYISYRAGAWAGGWVFILPNFVIVAAHRLASAQRYGNAWLKTGAAQGQLVCFAARTIVQVMFRQYFCRLCRHT
jgi:chromate transport protein ChrA